MATKYIETFESTAQFLAHAPANGKAQGFGIVSGVLYQNIAGSAVAMVDGTSAQTLTNKTLTAPVLNSPEITEAFNTHVGDGAITIASQTAYLTKGSAAAMTLAAPGAAGIGKRITITTGSDFAHVVTFTGSTLHDGTTGGHLAWTAAAFQGSSLTVEGVTATKWNVVSMNLGAIV